MKSHNFESFEKAIEHIVVQTNKGVMFSKKTSYNYYSLYYEDLIDTPQIEIKKICDWLGLEASQEWLTQISHVVTKTTKKEIPKHYIEVYQKTLEQYERLVELDRFKF